MSKLTGEQVRDAMIAGGIERVEHHNCSICGFPTAYIRRGDEIGFDPGCWCSSYGPREPSQRDWSDAANWINMQSNEAHRAELAAMFGITPSTSATTAADDPRSPA